jgi:FMN-dependent NADH-azoreductase
MATTVRGCDDPAVIGARTGLVAFDYLRQVLGFIGITDLDIILAGRPRAGANGETAVKQFGETVALAAAA